MCVWVVSLTELKHQKVFFLHNINIPLESFKTHLKCSPQADFFIYIFRNQKRWKLSCSRNLLMIASRFVVWFYPKFWFGLLGVQRTSFHSFFVETILKSYRLPLSKTVVMGFSAISENTYTDLSGAWFVSTWFLQTPH
jgi:hypothetical protein